MCIFWWCFDFCPCNWLCSLIELALKALDWVWGLIETVIGGVIDAIFNPILEVRVWLRLTRIKCLVFLD